MERKFVWPVRVYYEDTDASGVVYNASYFRFIERARTECLRELGFEQQRLLDELGVLFVVRTVTLDFNRPAKLDDQLEVVTVIDEVGKVQFSLVQELVSIIDRDKVLCAACVRIACLDKSFHPTLIPKAILRQFQDCLE